MARLTANIANQALVDELLHRAPRVLDRHVVHHLSRRRLDDAGLEGDGKVHQEEIQLLDAELRHRVDAALAHQLRAVVALPQFRCHPQLVTRAHALGERFRNRSAYLVFVHIHPRLVDVAVAARQRRLCALVDLAGFG